MGRPSTARTRLVESARELIHSSSYGTASVDDLCSAARVNKGSFYYFFPSKRDLALAVVDAQWESARTKVLEPSFATDIPPLERIVRFFGRAAAAQRRRPQVLGCPFGNLAVELATLDDAIRDKVGEVFAGYERYFEGAISEAIANGEIPPQEVAPAAEAMLAYLQGALLVSKTRNDAKVIERLGPLALNFLGAKR